ncbi:MAG: S8 family serine peptidase [Acidobacteriota bacterium]
MKLHEHEMRKRWNTFFLFALVIVLSGTLFLLSTYSKPAKRESRDGNATGSIIGDSPGERKRDWRERRGSNVKEPDGSLPDISFLAKESRLDSHVSSIMDRFMKAGKEEALKEASSRGFKEEEGLIKMVIEVESGQESEIMEKVKELGGRVPKFHGNKLQAYIPPEALEELSNAVGVKRIRRPMTPVPLSIRSQGVSRSGADQWQNLNINYLKLNRPVKVGILDIGFYGYDYLLGSELPSTVTTYSTSGDITGGGEYHGTACAEIVHDMAPEASLYLVNFADDVEFPEAVDYLISQKVDVISHSIGWFNAGPGDGTGPICQEVDRAASAGIVWVTAAGNQADSHWEGNFADQNSNDWNEFYGTDELYRIYLYSGYPFGIGILLNWDDWAVSGSHYVSSQDYDLYLYNRNGVRVAYSVDEQSGLQDQTPTEAIYYIPPTSDYYYLAINRYSATRSVKLELFFIGYFSDTEYVVPQGSLVIPADSRNALAVGAAYWWGNMPLEPFSSWGPTHDGRTKPDLCGYDGVDTWAYGLWDDGYGFYGTSAAAPHVAGAVALLKSKLGSYSLSQIVNIIKSRAKDMEDVGLDNKSGNGRLNLLKK